MLQLSVTKHAPEVQLKVSDLSVRPLWMNMKLKQLLIAMGFHQIGLLLNFNRTPENRYFYSCILWGVGVAQWLIVRALNSREKEKCPWFEPYCTADQRLCFCYTDSTIPLPLKFEISSFEPVPSVCTGGLCQTWSETQIIDFLMRLLK